MGFHFQKPTVAIEIEGKNYEAKIGDLDSIEKAAEISNRINEMAKNNDLSDTEKMTNIFREMRELLVAMLGQEAVDEIFEGRGNNFIDTMNLLTYVKKEISDLTDGTHIIEDLFESLGV